MAEDSRVRLRALLAVFLNHACLINMACCYIGKSFSCLPLVLTLLSASYRLNFFESERATKKEALKRGFLCCQKLRIKEISVKKRFFFVLTPLLRLLAVWHLTKNMNNLNIILCIDVNLMRWFVDKFGCEPQAESKCGQRIIRSLESQLLCHAVW